MNVRVVVMCIRHDKLNFDNEYLQAPLWYKLTLVT